MLKKNIAILLYKENYIYLHLNKILDFYEKEKKKKQAELMAISKAKNSFAAFI